MLPRRSTMTSRPAFPSDCRFLLRHTLMHIHKFLPPYRPRCAHTIWFTGRLQRQSESHRLRQTTSTTSPRTTSATTSHARTFLHKGYHLFLHRHQRPRKVRLPETRPQARRLSRRLHPASTPTMSPAPVSSSPRLGPRLLHLSPHPSLHSLLPLPHRQECGRLTPLPPAPCPACWRPCPRVPQRPALLHARILHRLCFEPLREGLRGPRRHRALALSGSRPCTTSSTTVHTRLLCI